MNDKIVLKSTYEHQLKGSYSCILKNHEIIEISKKKTSFPKVKI
jgi:hypothetical protein